MELVPVIKITLLIAAVLAIISILVSYITFKIKRKQGKVDTPSVGKIAKPIIEVENSVKKTVKRLTKPLLPPIQPVLKNATKENKNISSHKHVSTPPSVKPQQLNNSGHSNRIELVKNINLRKEKNVDEPMRPNYPNIEHSNKENLKSLGDEIINKYTDEHDTAMYALNVKKNIHKKKD